ncbi:MAG: GspH/FimT family pseudopilin [Candidatus Binatia bacterium]
MKVATLSSMPHKTTGTHRQGGFSLFEALVAISLASVVSLTALPVANEYVQQYQLVGAANTVAFDIARARMQAVGQNMFIRIRFLDAQHYVRERSPDGVAFTQDGAPSALPSGVSAQTPPVTTFNRNGMALLATTITLTNGESSKVLRTNILGRVTIS